MKSSDHDIITDVLKFKHEENIKCRIKELLEFTLDDHVNKSANIYVYLNIFQHSLNCYILLLKISN